MFECIINKLKCNKQQSIENVNNELDSLNGNKYDPKIQMGDKYWKTYFRLDDLNEKLRNHLMLYKYISVMDISVRIYERTYWECYNNRDIDFNINCEWSCGPTANKVKFNISNIIKEHLSNIDIFDGINIREYYNCDRSYPTELILTTAKKYVKCIDGCLPLNMATIKIMEYKGYSLLYIVFDELSYIDDINPNNFKD